MSITYCAERAWWRLNSPLDPIEVAFFSFIFIASLLDFGFTCYHLAHGATELNPLLAPFFNSGHFMEAFWIKTGLTASGLAILRLFSGKKLVRQALFFLSFVYTGLIYYHLAFISI